MNLTQEVNQSGLVKMAIDNGGSIHPLIIPAELTNGTGLMNPSIYVDGDRLLVNVRHVNYTLYHSENQRFQHKFGPLQYLNPENDITLRTWNYLCELDDDLTLKTINKLDTSQFDVAPLWEFIGLEDARVVRWGEGLYLCGVRRDTTTHGEGRMELSLIEDNREVGRVRMPAPGANDTYCEKNWMPILDQPFHWVKWTNPTEIVHYDVETNTTTTTHLDRSTFIPGLPDQRGSSHVVPYGNFYVALTHEVDLTRPIVGQKDATYQHRFVVWDRSWNIIKITDAFTFMNADIEFCCGMAEYQGNFLISFGFQDNCAFILKIPVDVLEKYLGISKDTENFWQQYPAATMEITTIVPEKGCVVDCVFCPQRTLETAYTGERILTLDNFKKLVDRIPTEVRITFAGFVEPWMNKYCTDMLLYAHEQGHPISVFTTAVGMSIEDCRRIVDIPYAGNPNGGFVLHLPDAEGLAKHPMTPGYRETLKWLSRNQQRIKNFTVMSMGPVHPDVAGLFDSAVIYQMYDRAGNLSREAILKPELKKVEERWIKILPKNQAQTCGCVEHVYHNVLLPNGDVSLCCMDYAVDNIIGNLYTTSYKELVLKPNTCFDICRSCENGVSPSAD
jgi:hypothetical protein